jgi:hypothetical protein
LERDFSFFFWQWREDEEKEEKSMENVKREMLMM